MKVNAIEINGAAGTIRIQAKSKDHVLVTATVEGGTREVAAFYAGSDEQANDANVMKVAAAVYGTAKRRNKYGEMVTQIAGTNSMIYEVRTAIEQVCGW